MMMINYAVFAMRKGVEMGEQEQFLPPWLQVSSLTRSIALGNLVLPTFPLLSRLIFFRVFFKPAHQLSTPSELSEVGEAWKRRKGLLQKRLTSIIQVTKPHGSSNCVHRMHFV